MNSASRLVAATVFAAGLVVSSERPSSAQFDFATLKCRAAVARSGVKLTKAVLKSLASCHRKRTADGNLAAVDCNDVSSADLDGKVGDAETKFTEEVTERCTGVVPATALYDACPAPCGTAVPSITTFADVAACLVCVDRAKLEDFGTIAYRAPTSPMDIALEAKCHRSITRTGAKLVSSVMKTLAKCQASDEKAGATTIDHCTAESALDLVDAAFNSAIEDLGDGDCKPAVPGTELDPCGNVTTSADLAFCVLDAARSSGVQLTARYLELPETTTTSTTTTTTTTLPVGDPSCPNVAEVLLYSRDTNVSCTTDADCDAPRTCDATLGKCTSATDLDLGWTGSGHDSDTNDGVTIRTHLYCPGPAGPTCGECDVVGIDASEGSCRCGNSSEVCSGMSDASNECPACSGGALRGAACADDADCSAGMCARRCSNDASKTCVGNADCPGGSCPLTNLRCGNGSQCSQTSDCTGTCTQAAACECHVGAPTPIVAGGTPFCLVQKLAGNFTGTLNVDLGAIELGVTSRTTVSLGDAMLSPCPVCGGKCSNDSAIACVTDDDCGGSNICVQDTAGDGIGDGLCINGRRDGQSCDVTATNASFPARAGAQGGAGHSLDCLPSVGKNISGAGLKTTLSPTTGTSTLPSTSSCGGSSPGLTCPCLVCRGDTSVACNSDPDCAAVASTCSGSTNFSCSSDSDCSSVDAGTCTALGGNRCSRLLSRMCATNSDCSAVSVGTCQASTCSEAGFGSDPLPNECDGGLCSGSGECTDGPDELTCDNVLRADGSGIFACNTNDDCSPLNWGIDAGNCSLGQRRKCFPDPIVGAGSVNPAYPVTAATYCTPPTFNTAVNAVLGLPGPARLVSQGELATYCASNPATVYTPGAGGCP